MQDPAQLQELLDSFDAGERRAALGRLVSAHDSGDDGPTTTGENVNMHLHSFFSYNAQNASPSHLAWNARRIGLHAAGLCDFDVLDGLEEFIGAGHLLGLRTMVSIETRVYLAEYAESDVTSPGEPGVTYIMGAGFPRVPAPDSAETAELERYRGRAAQRNARLVKRINAQLPDIAIDYDADVLPLTPAGNATERHIVRAYIRKARSVHGHARQEVAFWRETIGRSLEETATLMADGRAFEDVLRTRLVKRGGIGYEQPSPGTFPPAADFIAWVLACGAIPMITWLDGTTEAERNGHALVEHLIGMGAAALNIIPERNWNVADPDLRAVKRQNLQRIVEAAESLAIPVNIGTEMNSTGLPAFDDLDGDALRPYKEVFIRGADILVGQTVLARFARFSYTGEAAASEYVDRPTRNAFFQAVGRRPPLDPAKVRMLEDMGPARALSWLHDRVRAG